MDSLWNFFSKYITLSEEEKKAISDLNIIHSLEKDTLLLKEGQKSKSSYFVLKGCIRTFYNVDGNERTTDFHTEMQGLTPVSTLNGGFSKYNIACVEHTLLLVSDVTKEDEILKRFPKFETLCRKYSEEVISKQQIEFDDFKLSSPEQRYKQILKHRPDLIQRVPQYQLASYIGVEPQSLSRIKARTLGQKKN